jgi:hypothetical protein
MRLLIFAAVLGLLAVLIWAMTRRRLDSRLARLAASRDPIASLANFTSALSDVPGQVSTDVRALLQKLLPGREFPVLPDDSLWALYDLDQGTLESEVEDYLSLRGRRMTHISGTPPETVADLVRLVSRLNEDVPVKADA